MADEKRFENPLDKLRSAEKGRRFANPIRRTAGDVVREQYSKSSQRGNYVSHTFTFTPYQIAEIRRIAREFDMSLNATMRWFVDMALSSVGEGAEPELETVDVRKEPKLRNT